MVIFDPRTDDERREAMRKDVAHWAKMHERNRLQGLVAARFPATEVLRSRELLDRWLEHERE